MAASVTPRRHDTGPTVLDKRRDGGACSSAASLGGDVVGTDKISVPLESTGRTAEPATLRLCNPPPASRTGRRGASLIHQTNLDASLFGLVAQRPHEVGAAPLTQPQVLQSTDIPVGDAFGVSDQQGSYPLFNRKGDSLLCRLVVGLVDAAAMTSLGQALPMTVAAPATRTSLPWLWRTARRPDLPGLLITQVQVALGANGAARDKQPGVRCHQRVWVDDAKVHPSDTGLVKVGLLLDRYRSGHRQPKSPAVGQQRDRSNLLRRIREGPGQSHPQFRAALGDRQSDSKAVNQERAVVMAD
ncbi:MAG: hypothetical protein M3O65_12980 [Actinomycetota bacterium]|nr:hypothetical protein [Actinomycetota bacterium]